jgi:hypothetical protein
MLAFSVYNTDRIEFVSPRHNTMRTHAFRFYRTAARDPYWRIALDALAHKRVRARHR